MADTHKTLTTDEFSTLTGIAVTTVTRMLRQGRLRGEKRGGKWVIPESELARHESVPETDADLSSGGVETPTDPPASSQKTLDIEDFARLTYLTPKGVRQWLGNGRLSGVIGADGAQRVDAANLERPELRHLVRK
ncbi:MAG: helix-turn-helix domain-containing protein [Desulfosarcina sp.]